MIVFDIMHVTSFFFFVNIQAEAFLRVCRSKTHTKIAFLHTSPLHKMIRSMSVHCFLLLRAFKLKWLPTLQPCVFLSFTIDHWFQFISDIVRVFRISFPTMIAIMKWASGLYRLKPPLEDGCMGIQTAAQSRTNFSMMQDWISDASITRSLKKCK